MNDILTDTNADAKIAELERRVQALETKVATLPDAQKLEEHVTERVKASLPPPPPPQPQGGPPSFKDIELPIPSVNTLVTTAKTTWAVLEMFAELKLLFWMLVDRRYHMGWLTRLVTIGLVVLILLSHFIWPFARWDMVLSPIWDKLIDIGFGLILFMFLHFEMRRYKEWLGRR